MTINCEVFKPRQITVADVEDKRSNPEMANEGQGKAKASVPAFMALAADPTRTGNKGANQ